MSGNADGTTNVPSASGFMAPDVPIVGPGGMPSIEWYRFFLELYQHSGLALSEFKMWDELSIPGTGMSVGSGNVPTFTTMRSPVSAYSFSDSAREYLHGAVTMPGRYIDGTDLYAFIRWSPATTNTGDCKWSMYYSASEPEYGFPVPTNEPMLQAGAGVANGVQFFEGVTAIDGSALKSGDVIGFTVERDGAHVTDTMTGGAFMISAGFHYLAGVPGKNGRT